MTRLGILCPGQGDQSHQTLAPLQDDPGANRVLDIAAQVMEVDIRRIDPDRLHLNRIAQPLICAIQCATWTALRDHLPEPRVFAGYSVGELAAYGCAGSLDPAGLIHLAAVRAAAMDEACGLDTGLIAVRGLMRNRVNDLCRLHDLEIAIANDVDRLVIGGRKSDLDAFEWEATALGAGVTRLKISIASHTSFMAPAVEPFRLALMECAFKSPQVPVLAGVDASVVTTRARAVETLALQVAQTVEWSQCLDGIGEMGCDVLLEMGPGNGLARMVRDRFPDIPVRSVSEFVSLAGVVDWVSRQS